MNGYDEKCKKKCAMHNDFLIFSIINFVCVVKLVLSLDSGQTLCIFTGKIRPTLDILLLSFSFFGIQTEKRETQNRQEQNSINQIMLA